MKLTYIKQAGEPVGDGGDQYTGLDRFGRVIDQRWPQGSSELERVDYGFTRASNRQWRQELVASGQDEYYNYDGLYQVAASNRGALNGSKTGVSGTPSWTEDFNYDPIGNWDAYLTKVSGVTNLDQSRTQNTANQTVEIDGSTATIAHDPAGNMVKVPQVADWAATNELKWDAWNRLVEVKDGATTVAAYGYDGLNRRTTKTIDGATRRYYYSDQWQVLEERLDAETAAERQFVWGLRYLDDMVLRDRDTDHDESMDERLYVLSDYFNPTAIADEDGVVLERYGYDAFGLSRVMTPSFAPRSSSDFDWETRYGAYRYDAETGFYQVRYRYLHPTLGRWLSRDPISEKDGPNVYCYIDNNATSHVDTLGLWKISRTGKVRAIVTAEDCGESIETLAKAVGLDPKEYKFWLKPKSREYSGTSFQAEIINGDEFTIPNTIVIVIGYSVWRQTKMVLRRLANDGFAKLHAKGFNVVYKDSNLTSVTADSIIAYKNANLWGFAFIGHGETFLQYGKGSGLGGTFVIKGDEQVSAGAMQNQFHYGMVVTYACSAMLSQWEQLVSVNGVSYISQQWLQLAGKNFDEVKEVFEKASRK